MPLTLKLALENYRLERGRIVGGPHPSIGCSCSFCDVIRAADLLAELAEAEVRCGQICSTWWERVAAPGLN